MNTRELKNHPGHFLREDAANAFDAMEDKYGVIVLNRAGVPEHVQQGLIDRWNKGGPANRPPFLYEPKRPAKASEHVQYIAVDVYNYTSDRHKLNEFGFKWYGPKDPVHYTFTGWSGNNVAPAIEKEKEEMDFVNIQGKGGSWHAGLICIYRGNADGKLYGRRLTKGTINAGYPVLDNEAVVNLQKAIQIIDL